FSVGQAILQCLGCLLTFPRARSNRQPAVPTASSISVLPNSLHQDIINSLASTTSFLHHSHKDREHDICQSVSAVIMMVFQYSPNPAHHCQLLECLMILKQNILKDAS
ncbi:hypothetical protein NQ318_006861, partial [Aromia moschata]